MNKEELKAKDLRIGNYVFDDFKEVHKVEYISSDEYKNWSKEPALVLSKTNGLKGFYQSDEVFPIDLSEDWLLKLGFEKSKSEFSIPGCDRFNVFITITDKFLFCDGEKAIKYVINVHELQNLLFLIADKELILTETPCQKKE